MKTIITACAALIISMSMNAQNIDGTTLSIHPNSMIAMSGPKVTLETKFVVQLNSISLSQAVSLLVDDVPARKNSTFTMNKYTYDIVYDDGKYTFGTACFDNLADLKKHLKVFIKEILLQN